ncbi:MAG: asparagine synthase (glutamine-hydrolyzing) [Bacteroidia bacterium]|nr:asparagine synthase (glutamine-hydrolyzing) [Bacteroidia bacterium]
MCGIAGFVDFDGQSTIDTVRQMADTLEYRGPDDSGYELFDFANTQVGFGFRRLSILDLTPAGHQPMHFEEAGLTAMLNGELYNFTEVKTELEKLGHTFKSRTDTEVLLKAFSHWGINCIHRFRGMFAIAILDRKNELLHLIRDRAGVKPLYYFNDGQHFLFASELKAFHKHPHFLNVISPAALALYFQHGYIPAPYTIFSRTYKLLPGHYLTISLKSKSVLQKQYWSVTEFYNKPSPPISFNEAAAETERIMQQAFQLRMVSDVPVGVFLSGGYDSTLVTALIQKNQQQKLKTFTIGFEENTFNEAPYARQVAAHLGTDHHEYICTWREAMNIIPQLPEIYDEPFADSSAIPTYLVSKMAQQQVTVALSADGGDEIFAGYDKYGKCLRYNSQLHLLPGFLKMSAASLLSLVQRLMPVSNLARPDRLNKLILALREKHPAALFNIITQAMTQREIKRLLSVDAAFPPTAFEDVLVMTKHDPLAHYLHTDYRTFLVDDILCKVDRAGMAVSLEAREPLLDHRIIEYVASLPSHFKWHNGKGKRLLRHIIHQYVPAEMMERKKMGFNIPYEKWFQSDLKKMLNYTIFDSQLGCNGIFNETEIKKMIKNYFDNKPVTFQRIWSLFVFKLWFLKWMR